MRTCALCKTPGAPGIQQLSGLDLCEPCRTSDPAERLAEHGITAAWKVTDKRFDATLELPRQVTSFQMKCVPETWGHKLAKASFSEVEVGDPTFDDAIFVRTNDYAAGARRLESDGLQSAILAFILDTKKNQLTSNHVTLDGASLKTSTTPEAGMSEEHAQQLRLQTVAIALHLVPPG